MATFDLKSFSSALNETNKVQSGVDFTGKSLKLDTEKDAKDIIAAISACPDLYYLTLTGNTLGVAAAEAIAKALEAHPELKVARWSDMFTGRMKTEIPPALKALGDGMITAGARLKVLDLSDNAFGPIGVEGLAKLLQSDVCSELEELRLNNNGLGITGARLLAAALSSRPPKLRVFIAGRNRLENDGATALAHVFERMGSLEEVAMPQNGIYHVGISALSQAFKQNPQLSCLNLNDNTIGPKGAVAVAEALPKLRNLKAINFGDCLLKSKGARTLAKAFKDNCTQLECLDLSHNEIGRAACRELVDAITVMPDSEERLSRVVLAGNSLGMSCLQCLDLSHNEIGRAACRELVDAITVMPDSEERLSRVVLAGNSLGMSCLQCLDLSHNEIGRAACRELVAAITVMPDSEERLSRVVLAGNSLGMSCLQCLDLSHNEIGRAACRELVDAITVMPDSEERLSRVVLAGNSLGNAASKKSMQAQLGRAGELTDDDGDSGEEDDNEGTESEEEESDAESQEEENTEDSATEDAQHSVDTTATSNITLDTSGMEEVKNDVERFLKEPTLENLERLGPNAADVFEAHIESIQNTDELLTQYVNATLSAAGLSLNSERASDAAQHMFARTIAAANKRAASWPLTERLLRGLALIKSEEKAPLRWHLPACYAALARALPAHFPAPLRSTLRFFIGAKLAALPQELRDALQQHPVLLHD